MGGQTNAQPGRSVASAGDVNGDGYDDVVVGAPGYEQSLLLDLEGWAFLYHGSAIELSTSPAWSARSGLRGAEFGRTVASAGT